MKHVYIHIPFCKSICSYCDFCKMLYNETFVNNYLESLKKEIDEYYNGETVETIYIGGGTPSSLNINQLQNLFDILKTIKRTTSAEITFECNPNDINDILIKELVSNGVNRISIGIESFDKNKLNIMERESNFEDIYSKIKLLRYYGIRNINVDLIYGLPNETLDILKKDLKLLLKLKPEHISTYSLIIENHTKLNNMGITNINEELDREMYDYICKKLNKKGFNHYEVSNFSLKGKESKHNLAYWNNEEYYGFGLGASGYVNGFRYENTKNLTKYINGKYHLEENLLSKNEIMEYELMLGLRKITGINIQEFYDKYEERIEDIFPIKPLLKSNEIIFKNGNIYINPKYIYTMNEILLKLF